jgi:hypothetical protein
MLMTGLAIMSLGALSCSKYPSVFDLVDPRFVDPDMLMRYHWGLGIGHVYSHGHTRIHVNQTATPATTQTFQASAGIDDLEPVEVADFQDDSDIENRELGFRNDDEDLRDASADSVDSESDNDVELLDMVDMYGEGLVDDGWHDD